MNALQKQRDDIIAVRSRLGCPRPARPVVAASLIPPPPAPKPPRGVKVYSWPAGPRRYRLQPSIIARGLLEGILKEYNLSLADLLYGGRSNKLVRARHHLMWELRENTTWSLPAIGKFLGGLHHTTVLHAIERHEQRMREAGQ